MYDDIPEVPEAVRQITDEVAETSPPRINTKLLAAVGFIVLALVIGIVLWIRFGSPQRAQTETPRSSPVRSTNPEDNFPEPLLGHFSYSEAPTDELVGLVGNEQIQLRAAAADAYERMVDAALADGISLVPLSGFRSIADQEYLFFEVKEERAQVATQRAEVSAPPGHSEHHTGYAIDIGDPTRADTHLTERFEQTPVFQWLEENAARFSFELSFPRDNDQGISYEPWHWRFVGDQDSLETFYSARKSSNQ